MTSKNLYTFDPDHIGELIGKAQWESCWEYLGEVIENLTMGAGDAALSFSLQLQKDMQDEKQKEYVKDFGALLGELFLFLLTDDKVGMSDKSFYRLIFYHETLHSLFYIYDLDNTDAEVKKILDSHRKLRPDDQKKLLLLVSLNTGFDLNAFLGTIDRQYRMAAIVAYFSHRKIFKERIYSNKIALYDLRAELQRVHEQEKTFMQLVHPYFLCSYLKISDKNRIKRDINIAFGHHIAKLAGALKRTMDTAPSGHYQYELDENKPTVVVLNEYFSRNHAMYRGWGKLIQSLNNDFNVILLVQFGEIDYQLKKEFKNIFNITTLGDLHCILKTVKPDILFMPSVGMRLYNIIVSNARYAPIQIAGLGHPASTMSKNIDYVVSPKGLYDPAAFPDDIYIADGYPEKHSPLVSKEIFFAPLSDDQMPEKIEGKKILRVGIVGTNVKVSYPFFKLLKEIVAESPFQIHVSFMMGVGGMDSLYIEKFLNENFSNFDYCGWQPYFSYLTSLKKVDIVLNSFPFGHTNTIIDTLMCGKPCVGLDDVEPSSKTEGDVLNAVGLKDLFIVKTEEDYKKKFFELAKRILDGETVFFDREKAYDRIFAELGDYDYGKVMKWIYDHNAEMKSAGRKYFEVFEEI